MFAFSTNKMITVTQPSLPPLDEFISYLEKIWESKNLTNNGNFHRQLEAELAEFLGVEYVSLFANGTLALITAMQALKITGEVITTPYSFVATTHALHWNGITPVFADVEPGTLNLDPECIEKAISPATTAILPVHIYGIPCQTNKIDKIAKARGLKVIYDAAHAFGVKTGESSVCSFGDLSILSFHATKVFNTFEGGAIISHDIETKKSIDYLKNFGFSSETTIVGPGYNAKMNEFQAALGLLQLKFYTENIIKRKNITEIYKNELHEIRGIKMQDTSLPGLQYNYAYFPVFINENEFGVSRDNVYAYLKTHNIFTRRYFYPLISHFPNYNTLPSSAPSNLPVAEKAASEVLCLPLYTGLEETDALRISRLIKGMQG